MAPKRKTAQELKLSQARSGRIAERIAEEQREAGIIPEQQQSKIALCPFKLEAFKTNIQKRHDTWRARIVPGKAMLNEAVKNPWGPVHFGWYLNHSLTLARTVAEQYKDSEDPERRTQCHRFLADLEDSSGEFYMDCHLASFDRWFDLFTGGPYWEVSGVEILDVVDAIGWRKAEDGSPRWPDSFWQTNKHRNVIAAGLKIVRSLLEVSQC